MVSVRAAASLFGEGVVALFMPTAARLVFKSSGGAIFNDSFYSSLSYAHMIIETERRERQCPALPQRLAGLLSPCPRYKHPMCQQ